MASRPTVLQRGWEKSRKGFGIGFSWTWLHLEKLLAALALAVAIYAVYVAHVQLKASNQIAWDYSGGAQCSDYRAQVLELWKNRLTQEQIRQWFIDEAGGAYNAYGPTSKNDLAIDDFENNCGSVAQLLSHLPKEPPPGS
jgi:hypothetical protein